MIRKRPVRWDISKVVENNLCHSCGACDPSCHVDCITFEETNAGRVHPVIDYQTCTDCGVCYDVCPSVDPRRRVLKEFDSVDPFEGDCIAAYVGKATDKGIYENSQSGGMVTATLDYLFKEGLIDHALVVRMDDGYPPKVCYDFVQSTDELRSSQKSIYSPVNLLSALRSISDRMESIAVVGLSCHIEGVETLIKFKKKSYSIIKYKLGLICDGLLSKASSDYFLKKLPKDKDYTIEYRNKYVPSYHDANVTVHSDEKVEAVIDKRERFLLKKLITPPRCYICFNKMNIYADIIYGDPWGIKGVDMKNGESVVACRNEVGKTIIDDMALQGKAVLRPVSYGEVLDGQGMGLKKDKWLSAVRAYKNLGYMIPSYYQSIEKRLEGMEASFVGETEQTIQRFLSFEEMQRDQMTSYLSRKVRQAKLKRRVKKVLRSSLQWISWRNSDRRN